MELICLRQRIANSLMNYEDINEHKFCSVLKNGSTLDIDNWTCPQCGKLRETIIVVDNH